MPDIAKVYIWQNGQVMAFDRHGRQVPDYQGQRDEMMPKLLADARGADWYRGIWGGGVCLLTEAEKSDLAKQEAPHDA